MALYFVSLLLSIIPGALGITVEFKYYEPLLSVMVGVSGAIFTIMGIWIAHLYPGLVVALKDPQVINADFSDEKKDTKNLGVIVGVIIISAFNMATSVALLILVSIYTGLSFSVQKILLWIFQTSMLTISLTQLFAIFSVIYVCSKFVSEVRKASQGRGHGADN